MTGRGDLGDSTYSFGINVMSMATRLFKVRFRVRCNWNFRGRCNWGLVVGDL